MLLAVAPPGGIGNLPAIAQGDPGPAPTFRNVDLTELAADDPTPASATWTLVTPATGVAGPVYDLELSLHRGENGDEGTMTILDADDLDGDPVDGYILQVKSLGGTPETFGVEMVALRVGNTYWPTTVNVLSNATGNNAIAQVTIPPHPFPTRFHCNGQTIIDPDGADVQVDVVARLGATDGVVIARGLGLSGGATQVVVLSPSPPVGSAPGFGEVAAGGSGTVVYIRAEQVGSGTDTYDTLAGRALYSVTVDPIG